VILAGVPIAAPSGLMATSDGDVAVHAVIDALLGAAALGDLGAHFPSSDDRWRGADSLDLLREAVRLASNAGVIAASADVTVVAEAVPISPHREAMRANLASALGIPVAAISVKATTTDGMGFIGRGEGIAAMAVVVAHASP